METKKYVPSGPYVFQSGWHERKAAEILMFQDYPFVSQYLKKLNSMMGGKMNRLHLHLDWLIRQGENRTAKVLCQWCGHESSVRIFSASGNDRNGYSINMLYTCCGRPECLESIEMEATGRPIFLPLKFSSILRFRRKADQRLVVWLLRNACGLPDRLTKEAAFCFFSEP